MLTRFMMPLLIGATAAILNPLTKPGKQPDGSYLVETEQVIKPWGRQISIDGRPVDLAFDAERQLLAVLNSSTVELRSSQTGQLIGSFAAGASSYCGIVFRPHSHEIWASQAGRTGSASIFVGQFDGRGKPQSSRKLLLPDGTVPAGLVFSPNGRTLYAALSRRNAVGVFDADTLALQKEIPVGVAPFALAISADGRRLAVTNRGHMPQPDTVTAFSAGTPLGTDPRTGAVLPGSVTVIDLPTMAKQELPVGQAPAGLAFRPDSKILAVANAYSGSLSLFNLRTQAVSELKIDVVPSEFGSQPIACVFSADGQRLYAAAAGINAIAVSRRAGDSYTLAGFVPAGWFPSALADVDGRLNVINIKGNGSTVSSGGGYRARAFHGSLQMLPPDFEQHLAEATADVRQYNRALTRTVPANLASLGIRHVLLLIKENRTYDQVFGDLRQGNGDESLVMYGRDITPNHHALAERYVLLDNFYATGAISLDGHQWLEQGFVGDHVERALTNSPRGYAWDLSDALDVSPAGFFWQRPERPLSVRVGGILSLPAEFQPATQMTRDIDESDLHPWRFYWDAYRANRWQGLVGGRAAVPALAPFMDRRYPVNSMKITDQIRASVIEQELTEAEHLGHLPDLMVFGMTSDHTMGTDPAAPTPSAMVADNDYALGRIVEAVSRSRFWSSTLILAVEDDSQGGVDHIDGHRTVALAVGPMVKRSVVDSNFYTQLSMIRTVQTLLGIRPATRFQRNARVMDTIFTEKPDLQPYVAMKPHVALDVMNPPFHSLSGKPLWAARESARINWNHVDDLPTAHLNQILWWDHAGYHASYPVRR